MMATLRGVDSAPDSTYKVEAKDATIAVIHGLRSENIEYVWPVAAKVVRGDLPP
jgi:hypothetical protein